MGLRRLRAHDTAAVAEAKAAYRAGHRRRFRPWLPEPGLWFQWDYGDGPLVDGRKTWLWCAWLAWSRFRVVLPIRDKTLPTVIACIDAHAAPIWRRPDVRLERQREDAVGGPHRAHCGAPPDDGGGRPLLRPDVGQLCAGGPAVEGWIGGNRAHRVRRPGADRRQPVARLLELRRVSRVPCDAFCERVNARAAPRHAVPADRTAGARTRAAPPAASRAVHGVPSASRERWARLSRRSTSTVASTRSRMTTSARRCGCVSRTTRS